MKHRFFIVLGIIVAGLAVWAWVTANYIVAVQRDVDAKFRMTVQYYTDMRQEYIDPLQNLPGLSADDKRGLADISTHLRDMAALSNTDDQYPKLLAVQHEMIAFFTKPGTSEMLTTDVHFSQWNTNAGHNGKSSQLINDYNQALKIYNVAMKSPVGRVFMFWPHWNHPQYLSVDGSTQPTTTIIF